TDVLHSADFNHRGLVYVACTAGESSPRGDCSTTLSDLGGYTYSGGDVCYSEHSFLFPRHLVCLFSSTTNVDFSGFWHRFTSRVFAASSLDEYWIKCLLYSYDAFECN